MTTPTWQAGTLYPNGFLVKPASAPPPAATAIPNAGFESGDTGWTKGTGWTINSGDQPFQGTWSAKYNNTGTTNLDMDTTAAVAPGQSITASCMVQQGASSAGQAGATVALVWLTAAPNAVGKGRQGLGRSNQHRSLQRILDKTLGQIPASRHRLAQFSTRRLRANQAFLHVV